MGDTFSVLKPEETEEDITFEEETKDVTPPPDPMATSATDYDVIIDNVEGTESLSVGHISAGYAEVKKSVKEERDAGNDIVYEDKAFPSSKKSLYYSKEAPKKWEKIQWKRPSEISTSPKLLCDGISSEDIVQGFLGNCWWLASCAAVSRQPKFLKKIIPTNQPLSGENYLGVFHFRFWRFGSWVEVIVDDTLPTIDGELCFGRSSDTNEFWLPLLEKAYSKLHYSYQAIEGGFTKDGMEDLTGGIALIYNLGDDTPKGFFHTLSKALRYESFVCASIEGGDGNVISEKTGLISAHAYALLRAVKIKVEGEVVRLLKLRNPWGNEQEWKGAWSDDSKDWDNVSEKTKKRLGYADKDNGEWWMTFEDFTTHFNDVTICSIGPDFDGDGVPTGDRWLVSSVHGEWNSETAGGSRNNMSSYTKNPQYYIEIKEPDDFDPEEDHPDEEGKSSIIIGLMQEYRRSQVSKGVENLYIAINIFKVKERPKKKLGPRYFLRNFQEAGSGPYTNIREVTITAELDPGKYVIVPSSYKPEEFGHFLIRIFTEKTVVIEEL